LNNVVKPGLLFLQPAIWKGHGPKKTANAHPDAELKRWAMLYLMVAMNAAQSDSNRMQTTAYGNSHSRRCALPSPLDSPAAIDIRTGEKMPIEVPETCWSAASTGKLSPAWMANTSCDDAGIIASSSPPNIAIPDKSE